MCICTLHIHIHNLHTKQWWRDLHIPMYYIYEKFLMRVIRIHFFPTTKVIKNGIIPEKLVLKHEYKLQHFIHNVYL